MQKIIINGTLIFTMSILAFAQDKVGTCAAQFLQIPVGGKAIAMGGAFTALADDATALYWNPGAISRAQKHRLYAAQSNWLVESKLQWLGAQFMITSADALGISITNLNYGTREKVTTVAQPEGTGEYWDAGDLAFVLSYARNLTDRFSIGGSAKYIQQRIWHESASQLAFDLGLLFITQFNGLTIGACMRNFGGDLGLEGRDLLNRIDLDPDNEGNNETIVAKLKTEHWPLPLTFVVGASMPVLNTRLLRWTVAADAVRPTDNSQIINMGTEINIMQMLSVRGGYQTLFRSEKQEGLTLGLGLNVPVANFKLGIDLSYQDFGLFGMLQTTAVNVSF
jgi:hypothetical protein